MDRYQLLDYLEGRYILVTYHYAINGEIFTKEKWQKVECGSVYGQYALINLNLHEVGRLEEMARTSLSQVEYEAMVMNWQIQHQVVAG